MQNKDWKECPDKGGEWSAEEWIDLESAKV